MNSDFIEDALSFWFQSNLYIHQETESLKMSSLLGSHVRVNYFSDLENFSVIHTFKHDVFYKNIYEVLFMYKDDDGVIKAHKQEAMILNDSPDFYEKRKLFLVDGINLYHYKDVMFAFARYENDMFLCDLTTNPKISYEVYDNIYDAGMEPFTDNGSLRKIIRGKSCYNCVNARVDQDGYISCKKNNIIHNNFYLCVNDYRENV